MGARLRRVRRCLRLPRALLRNPCAERRFMAASGRHAAWFRSPRSGQSGDSRRLGGASRLPRTPHLAIQPGVSGTLALRPRHDCRRPPGSIRPSGRLRVTNAGNQFRSPAPQAELGSRRGRGRSGKVSVCAGLRRRAREVLRQRGERASRDLGVVARRVGIACRRRRARGRRGTPAGNPPGNRAGRNDPVHG